MKPARILVCGGRDFTDELYVQRVMDALSFWFEPKFCIVHGGARGADKAADAWAHSHGYPVFTAFAPWSYYGNGAGPTRNQWMITWFRPELVVAFPGATGTADMMRRAASNGIPVYDVAKLGVPA